MVTSETVIERLDQEIKLWEKVRAALEKTTFRDQAYAAVKLKIESKITALSFANSAVVGLNPESFSILAGIIVGEHRSTLSNEALKEYGYPGYPAEEKQCENSGKQPSDSEEKPG